MHTAQPGYTAVTRGQEAGVTSAPPAQQRNVTRRVFTSLLAALRACGRQQPWWRHTAACGSVRPGPAAAAQRTIWRSTAGGAASDARQSCTQPRVRPPPRNCTRPPAGASTRHPRVPAAHDPSYLSSIGPLRPLAPSIPSPAVAMGPGRRAQLRPHRYPWQQNSVLKCGAIGWKRSTRAVYWPRGLGRKRATCAGSEPRPAPFSRAP